MRYSEEVKDFIFKNNYGHYSYELADMVNKKFGLNLTANQIKCFRANYKLNCGLSGHFQKGHMPFNKGKRVDEYMSKENQEKCKAHRFTKGKNVNNQRWKWRELGEERITKDGYVEVKVSQNGWKLKHRLVYEKAHNVKLTEKDVILFLDQNKRNFNVDNLKLITRNELKTLNQNGLISERKEANETGLILAKYLIKVKWRENEKNNKFTENR